MRRWLENLEQFAIEVILGRRQGARAVHPAWPAFRSSLVYARLVQLRLFLYRKRILRERALGCLVISIGNLTVGGTGKTPVVEKFARALQVGGRRVAILSRGYKSVAKPSKRSWFDRLRGVAPDPPRIVSDGQSLLLDSLTAGDEPYMLANNLKDVIVLVDKDRVKSGLHAIREMKADTLSARRRTAISPSQASARHRPDRSAGAVWKRGFSSRGDLARAAAEFAPGELHLHYQEHGRA